MPKQADPDIARIRCEKILAAAVVIAEHGLQHRHERV
jgi:hypothetical protein